MVSTWSGDGHFQASSGRDRKCWKCSVIGIIFAIGCRSPFQERLLLVRQSQLTPSRLLHNQRYVTGRVHQRRVQQIDTAIPQDVVSRGFELLLLTILAAVPLYET